MIIIFNITMVLFPLEKKLPFAALVVREQNTNKASYQKKNVLFSFGKQIPRLTHKYIHTHLTSPTVPIPDHFLYQL